MHREHYMDLAIKQFLPRRTDSWIHSRNSHYYPTSELLRFIVEVREAYTAEPSRTDLEQDLDQLCRLVASYNAIRKASIRRQQWQCQDERLPFSDGVVSAIVGSCLNRGKLILAEAAFSSFEHSVPSEVVASIKSHVHRFTFEQLERW